MSLDFLVPYEVRVDAKPFDIRYEWVTNPRSGGSIEVPPEPIGLESHIVEQVQNRLESDIAFQSHGDGQENLDAMRIWAPIIPGMWLVFRHGRLVAGATSAEEAWGLGYPREGTLIAFSCYPRPNLMESER